MEQKKQLFVGYEVHLFLTEKKRVCLFLSSLRALLTKKEFCEQITRLSTIINGSRSCYVTVKRLAFLSAETKLARTIQIFNNILN